MQFNELLGKISFDTFNEIIELSPRKVRESLYSFYGIKPKSKFAVISVKEKREQRNKNLHLKLQEVKNSKELDFLKELLRNWLFNKRPMLKSALDFLEIENDNGLIEIDTNFFEEMDKETAHDLYKHLSEKFPKDEVMIYLSFMAVPHLESYWR